MSFRFLLVASTALALCTAPALAADSRLQLIVGGEAYDGPPRFSVTFGGKDLGEAEVTAAIDTVSVGRFADAADRAAYVQSFEFTIPEDMFSPGGEVRVRLINEAYGGDGSNRDRNLYLASVAVNGRAVTLSGFETQGARAGQQNETLGEFLVLADGNVEGVSRPPETGWPLPAAANDAVAVTGSVPAATPAVTAELAVPQHSSPVAEAVAALPAAPPEPAADSCSRSEIYNVIGFNESSNDLTPRLTERLDQIIADIGSARCRVLVTGYSSRQGAHATNALFAIERAQNVLAYLREQGLGYQSASATGGGATEQFGSDFASNRRVVISVSP